MTERIRRGRTLAGTVAAAVVMALSVPPSSVAETPSRDTRTRTGQGGPVRIRGAVSKAGAKAGTKSAKHPEAGGAGRTGKGARAHEPRHRVPTAQRPGPDHGAPTAAGPEPETQPEPAPDPLTPVSPPDPPGPSHPPVATEPPEPVEPAPVPDPPASTRPDRDDTYTGDRDDEAAAPDPAEQGVDDAPATEPAPPATPEPAIPAEPAAQPAGDPTGSAAPRMQPDPSMRGDLAAALAAATLPQRPPPEVAAVLEAFGTDRHVRDTDIGGLGSAVGAAALTEADPTLVAVTRALSSAFGAETTRSLGAIFGAG